MYGDEAISYIINSIISTRSHCTIVKVVAVDGGGVDKVGYVDVLPLIDMLDGYGDRVPHATVHRLPYMRLQGGRNAIIVDPAVGDIGICVVCDRDISITKEERAQSSPPSLRANNISDGLYVGGILNGAPEQYIHYHDGGIRINTPNDVSIDCNAFVVNAKSSVITADTSAIKSSSVDITGVTAINGATSINGTLTQQGGGASSFSGDMSGQGSITMSGQISTSADVISGNGKSLNRAQQE